MKGWLMSGSQEERWLDGLSDEDVAFLKRFVLASGSLKALAKVYSISYPTVRVRVDRLIEKIKVLDTAAEETDFVRTVRVLHADGRIDLETLNALLSAYRAEQEDEQ